ncbi:hypothetical protein [Streptomyces sp. NBC_00233]|uniref:hypothetical protein n=1 Tax=Streptomyces sp. NBC_00233 TaxID=2975686 RepID=UPI002254CF07|nr:hypothetical protein [Streptomyces sp. NBC_00233]MCX5230904.1 hypothetical protein [Streptomyces sp. NBC_00233]
MLIEAVVVVATPASDQVAWLDRYDVPPDEIALGFDDAFRLAGRLVDEGRLSREVLPSLQMIDEVFSEMAQVTDLDRWTRAALTTDAGWGRARQLAREVLTAESEEMSPLPVIRIVR